MLLILKLCIYQTMCEPHWRLDSKNHSNADTWYKRDVNNNESILSNTWKNVYNDKCIYATSTHFTLFYWSAAGLELLFNDIVFVSFHSTRWADKPEGYRSDGKEKHSKTAFATLWYWVSEWCTLAPLQIMNS